MATSVMAFGIATAVIALQSGFKHLDLARGTTLASQIIQSEMERVRLMSWSGVASLPATDTFDGALHFDGSSALAGKYSVTRACTPDSARPAEIMHIDVAVSWRGYDGRLHSRNSVSIYAKNGLYDYYYTIAHP